MCGKERDLCYGALPCSYCGNGRFSKRDSHVCKVRGGRVGKREGAGGVSRATASQYDDHGVHTKRIYTDRLIGNERNARDGSSPPPFACACVHLCVRACDDVLRPPIMSIHDMQPTISLVREKLELAGLPDAATVRQILSV